MRIEHTFSGNVLDDIYAKGASDTIEGMAVLSFPFTVKELPEGTKSLAWSFIDYDAVPVCGFPYIHWLVANVPIFQTQIPADFSRKDKEHLEGKNSLTSKFLSDAVKVIDQQYIGPKPPDKDHKYQLMVYALDSGLDLANGFYLNELYDAMAGHILEVQEVTLIGKV